MSQTPLAGSRVVGHARRSLVSRRLLVFWSGSDSLFSQDLCLFLPSPLVCYLCVLCVCLFCEFIWVHCTYTYIVTCQNSVNPRQLFSLPCHILFCSCCETTCRDFIFHLRISLHRSRKPENNIVVEVSWKDNKACWLIIYIKCVIVPSCSWLLDCADYAKYFSGYAINHTRLHVTLLCSSVCVFCDALWPINGREEIWSVYTNSFKMANNYC